MQAEVATVLHSIRVRDCVLTVICALFVYLLRAKERFDLQPVWCKHINAERAYANGRFASPRERLPAPIVTDIDDDGNEEIVLVSGDFELQICPVPQPETVSAAGFHLPELNNCNSIEMVLDNSHRPVVIETGYIFAPKSQHIVRSQVIIVIFDDWTVHCYDSSLRLLWSQVLMDLRGRHGYVMNAVGVLITPHVINNGQNGTVIVGASFAHVSHGYRKQSNLIHSGLYSYHDKSAVNNQDEMLIDEKYRHFSTFALNGGTGRLLWHHLPGDFEQEGQETTPYHWKLGLKRGHWHAGEVYWTKYAENLLRHLPHSWRDVADTRFDLAELRRAQVVKDRLPENSDDKHQPTLAPLADIIGLYDEHVIGRPYGGMRAHSRHEHVKRPNAVVLHISSGIEVLSFQTGRPLTHLSLAPHSTASVFADVDEDNNIEEVRADFTLKCVADVSTVNPRPHALFTGPLCESPFWWGGISFSNMFQNTDIVNEDTHLAVTPVVVPRVAQSYGMLNHLLGRSLPSEQKGFDSIFLTSAGRMSSFSPSGEPNWQNVLPASWSQIALQWELNPNFAASESGQVYDWAFRPSMKPLPLQVYGRKTAMLVSGWDSVALVDLRDGHLAGEHSLPCQPTAEPVIGDFNRDGWSDFVVLCSDGIIGFEIHKSSTFLYTGIVTVTVVLSVLLLMWCCMQPDDSEDNTSGRQVLT